MYQTEDILEGARTIRPHLHELVGGEAERVDDALADLLARAELGQKTDTLILDLLSTHKATKDWMRDYLSRPYSLRESAGTKGYYTRPGGDSAPISAQRYVCPVAGDTVWYRQYAGEDIPMCNTHGVQLVVAP